MILISVLSIESVINYRRQDNYILDLDERHKGKG